MIINTAGEYTLQYTATDACGNSTVVNRELTVEAPPYYGAVWDGSNSPQWTRTGLATGFADPVSQISDGNGGWTVGSSPFDNIMPWSGMLIVEDAEAGTLVSIPKFYYKWVRDELNVGSMELRIANEPLDGFHVSPAHADRGDGAGERDVVYVGRYHCASDYKSTRNVLPSYELSRTTYRSGIHALGNDIWQYDFAMYWTICMLYLVEFANWNSQNTVGYGCGTASSLANEGATDSMTYHTGTNATSRSTHGEMQYRHIEGLWSNLRDWVDGIYFNGTDIYVINNPADFSDTANGTLVGTRANTTGVPVTFTNPSVSGYEYALYPETASGTNYSRRTCDGYYFNLSMNCLNVGGSHSNFQDAFGLFMMNGNFGDYQTNYVIGSRLMKLPSA